MPVEDSVDNFFLACGKPVERRSEELAPDSQNPLVVASEEDQAPDVGARRGKV
jgi:hypothetical protein